MKVIVSSFLLAFCFYSLPVIAQEKASPEAEVFFQKAMTQINPRHVAWVKSTAKNVNEKNLAEAEVRNLASQYAVLGSLSNADIEALTLLIMMEASRHVYNDIREMLEGMEATRKKKAAMREAIELLKNREADNKEMPSYEYDSIAKLKIKEPVKTKPVSSNLQRADTTKKVRSIAKATKVEIGQLKKELTDKLDSMNEVGEMESLRLQMAMDRRSKMMNALSNIQKKISDTQNSIIQNLK